MRVKKDIYDWEDDTGIGDYCVVVAHDPTFDQLTLLFAKTGMEMVWDVVGMLAIFERVVTNKDD